MTYTPISPGTLNWDAPVNAAFAAQDSRITANEVSNTTQDGRLTALEAATDSLGWQPDEMGLVNWSWDPSIASGFGIISTTQAIYFTKMPVRKTSTITNIVTCLTAAGSTLTAGQNLVGLYSSAGTLIAQSADQSANWTTAGTKIVPLSAPQVVSPGFYYAAVLSNGTTPVTLLRGNSVNAAVINTGGSFRHVETSGNTSLPASFTPGSATQSTFGRWAAFS